MDDGTPPPDQRDHTVWRQDDHGNQFVVQRRLTRQEAEAVVRKFGAHGHKQLYWIESSATADRTPRSSTDNRSNM